MEVSIHQCCLIIGWTRSCYRSTVNSAFNDYYPILESRYAGNPPAMIKVVAEEPGEPCALPTDDSSEFMLNTHKLRAPAWRNEVTLRSVEMFIEYEPGFYIPDISPTPFLLVVAGGDHLVSADIACGAYEQALEPKKLLILPGGHFDAYTGDDFKLNTSAQRDWFVQHLKP